MGSPQGSVFGQASRPRPQQEMCMSSSTRKVSVLRVSIPDCITLPHGITPCCQMQKHRQSCCKTIAFLDQILTLLKISLKTCLILGSLGSKLSPNTHEKVHYYQPRNYANKLLQSIGRKFLVHPEGTLLSRISACKGQDMSRRV